MDDHFIIKPGWLIDGTGSPARSGHWVRIKGGCIHEIGSGLPSPPAETIDLPDSTLMPCLIDAHVHMHMSGTTDEAKRRKQLELDDEAAVKVIQGHVKAHLKHGIIAIRDGGDPGRLGISFVQAYKMANPNCTLTILSPGWAWRAQGRYGSLIGHKPEPSESLEQAIKRIGPAVDHVKIVQSGINSLIEFGRHTQPQFKIDQLKQAVMSALKMGLKTMIHANGPKPVRLALQAGCASVEHGFFMGRDNLEFMAELGAIWVPTTVTMQAYADTLKSGDPKIEVTEKTLEHQINQISMARQLGVTLAVGTDSGSMGVYHGQALMGELKLFVTAGYTTEQALACATMNNARLLGLDDRLGTVTVGKRACLMAVHDSPENLLDNLTDPKMIWHDGAILNHDLS